MLIYTLITDTKIMSVANIDYRQLANDMLSKHVPELSPDQSKDLEIGIYNWTIEYANKYNIFPGWKSEVFVKIYDNKLISILTNLDQTSHLKNVALLKRLKDNEFKPHDIAFMEPYEMYPERWMSILNKKLKKEQSLLDSNMEAKTDMFKCGKCKQRKCSYYEMQVRSADESSTIFVTCLNCKNKWRIG